MCKLCSFAFSQGVAWWWSCESTGKFTENGDSDLVILQCRQVAFWWFYSVGRFRFDNCTERGRPWYGDFRERPLSDGFSVFYETWNSGDTTLRWNASLPRISCESGWFSSLEIIPDRTFLLIRMIFLTGNHPWQDFLANQDEFSRWKSSLPDISC